MLEFSSLDVNEAVAAFTDHIKLEEFLAILFHCGQVPSMHNLGRIVNRTLPG